MTCMLFPRAHGLNLHALALPCHAASPIRRHAASYYGAAPTGAGARTAPAEPEPTRVSFIFRLESTAAACHTSSRSPASPICAAPRCRANGRQQLLWHEWHKRSRVPGPRAQRAGTGRSHYDLAPIEVCASVIRLCVHACRHACGHMRACA